MIWNDIKKTKPMAYQTGCWDGKKSDKVLVADKNRKIYIAEMYEGFIDGSEFCDFYDDRDNEINNVIYWTEIENPF